MSHVLIAGCGYVGVELGVRLAEAGHNVWGLRRHPTALPSAITPVTANLLDPTTLANLSPDTEFVFYTAAAAAPTDEAYRAAYVEGPNNLVAALVAQRARLRRLFFTSSTAVYAQSHGEWVDENSPTAPTHFTGRRLLEAEQAIARAPYPTTILRLAGIYGPGRTQTIESVRTGVATYAPGPPVFMNHIHRDDCVGVFQRLMGLERPGPLYVGVDHAPAPRHEILCWLAEHLRVPAPRCESASPRSPQRSNKRCRNTRVLGAGYVFQYPTYREGYTALIAAKGSA